MDVVYYYGNSSSYASSSVSSEYSSATSESSADAFCYDQNVENMIKPHRAPVTTICSIVAGCMIAGSIYLLVQRNSFIFRRKAAIYLVLATCGLLLYVRDTIAIVWTYPAYDCAESAFILYYVGAVPFHIIPLLIRSWRTFCIYRATPNILTCRYDTLLNDKVRRHKWMVWRMSFCYLCFLLILLLLFLSQDAAYYAWIGLEGAFNLCNFLLTWKLFSMRAELRNKMLDETKSLFIYASIAIIEVIYSNTMYIVAGSAYENTYLIIYYMYGDIFLVSAMWFLTGGKAVYFLLKTGKEVKPEKPHMPILWEYQYGSVQWSW